MFKGFEGEGQTSNSEQEQPGNSSSEARHRSLLAARMGRAPGGKPRQNRTDWSPRLSPKESTELKRKKARLAYLEEHPGDQEGAELMAGFEDFLESQNVLETKRTRPRKERLEIIQSLTEFNFLWTHYLYSINDNPQAVQEHWNSLKKMAKEKKSERQYAKSRSGILSQVAMMEIFSELGLQSSLAKPKEDAFRKTDLWVEHAPVQIKTGANASEVAIIKTESRTASPIGSTIEKDGQTGHFTSAELAEADQFRLKLDEYARESGQGQITGFFVVIPRDQINRNSGKPTPKLVQEVKAKLEELGYLNPE